MVKTRIFDGKEVLRWARPTHAHTAALHFVSLDSGELTVARAQYKQFVASRRTLAGRKKSKQQSARGYIVRT